jgi:hypothetical protein
MHPDPRSVCDWVRPIATLNSAAEEETIYMRSEVFAEVTKVITIFRDVTSCSLQDLHRHFGGTGSESISKLSNCLPGEIRYL